jgi:hypothetical protein
MSKKVFCQFGTLSAALLTCCSDLGVNHQLYLGNFKVLKALIQVHLKLDQIFLDIV